ncbi:two-component system response regulator RppA [Oscillatoria laete-virens NRMC-F 0139]|nr:two-component system response regulator RppA [Oscillatoria laete-virens]MDL5052066.1 two-component system response regulator RppA [Oscillatoria laete-virens NRMC-F 0139]
MRILFVEDDLEQLEPLAIALTQAGHVVDAVEDGQTAQWLMGQKEYDLLILDWMLPDLDGIQLCRLYREAGKGSPILLLTAKDTVSDRVMGLDAGADDYLTKPADVKELLARVRALGRRSPLWTGDRLCIADLQLHLSTMTAERQDREVSLSSREFQLLEYLMRHPKQVLKREQIELALWEWGTEPESNAVATSIRRLRQRLKPLNCETWIDTVHGTGYRLLSPEDDR